MGTNGIKYYLSFDIDHPFDPVYSEDEKLIEREKEDWDLARELMLKMSEREQDVVYFFCVKQWSDKQDDSEMYEWKKRNRNLDDSTN